MKKNLNVTANIIWNTLGSVFYCGCQWLLNVSVVRFSDDFSNAGILSLAMSISAIFFVISLFNVRNYQVSDSDNLYSPEDYVFHRILTCLLSFIMCAVFVLINGYNLTITLSVLSFMAFRVIEAIADVFHGEAQKIWRLDIAGKSCIIRGVLFIAVFTVTIILSDSLPLALFLMALATVIPLIFYDYASIKKLINLKLHLNKSKIVSLTKICLPMVGYGLCINSIIPLAKYFIDFYHGENVLGPYSTVSAVAVLVQTLVLLIFTPLIAIFNDEYRKGNKRAMNLLLLKLTSLLIAITLVSLLLVLLVGKPVMALVFGEEIIPYVYLLYPTIIASSLTALVWLLGMILVVMRSMACLICGALIGTVISLVICVLTVPSDAYFGANLAIILSFAIISIFYISKYLIFLFSKSENDTSEVQNVND